MPDRKVIYIAGKYRGPNAWAIERNIRAAAEVAAQVWSAGHIALCPHMNSAHMEGAASDDDFLAGTLELLRRSDAVLLVPGWEDSAGAKAEVAEADQLRLPVFGRESYGYTSPDLILAEALVHLHDWASGIGLYPVP